MKKKGNDRRHPNGLLSLLATLGLLFPMLLNLVGGIVVTATTSIGNVSTTTTAPKVTQEGCAIKIETTEEVAWALPRQPIDLVILQDTSGSFRNTIDNIKTALTKLTTAVPAEKYDYNKPKLVFTNDPKTTDRVMIGTYQGIDKQYIYTGGSSFSGNYVLANDGKYDFDFSELTNDPGKIKTFLDNEVTKEAAAGGTPTVPAIDDFMKQYQVAKAAAGNNDNRKTVFLLITDGVANGVRKDNQIVIEKTKERIKKIANYYGFTQEIVNEFGGYEYYTTLNPKLGNHKELREGGWDYSVRYDPYDPYRTPYYFFTLPEGAQDYITRSQELVDRGNKLKQELGSNSEVVIGFWEDIANFRVAQQYGDGYEGGYLNKYGIDDGATNAPVRNVFHDALHTMASPDKVVNGKNVSFYVDEQKDVDLFAQKVLDSVTAAMVRENVNGEFEVTEGYKVESVTINGKKVVETVKDDTKEIPGTVKQEGRKVTISVPESVFNPGNNKFDYELKRTEEAENLDEADETEPPANYTPPKVEREVGQLVGTFKVGDYESAEIGSKTPTHVQVTDLKYCYPRVTKDVKDKDQSNDKNGDDGQTGHIAQDPLLVDATNPAKTIKRPSYAASLTTEGEAFTYSVDYNMYNVALEMKKNVMFVDALDYRVKFISAKVTDDQGKELPGFTVSTKETQDDNGNANTTIIADVPQNKGEQTKEVNEGEYGGHKFKKYRLVITAEIKDEYKLDKNATEYYKMMQENDGLGFANQAKIVWNGDTKDLKDPNAKTRRSNNVFVTPPLETDITKEVTQEVKPKEKGSEHLDLPAVDDTYFYTIESTWPGIFDEYLIEDILVPELESLNKDGEDKVYVNGQESEVLKKYLKVDQVEDNGKTTDRVYFELKKEELTSLELRRINREIAKLNEGNDGPAKIKLGIKAKIRENADLSKYHDAEADGQIKVPNEAKVKLNNKSKTSKKVTVTPPGMPPKPEKTVDEKPSLTLGALEQVFTYEVKATVPKDVAGFTKFELSDDLEDILTITETKVTVGGKADAAVTVTGAAEANANATTKGLVVASLPSDKISNYKGQEMVLTIKARIKEGVTTEELGKYVDNSIPNKATIKVGDKPNQTEDTENVPVTPPGETPKPTKTVDDQASLNLAGLEQEFTYRVKATVPQNVTGFTKFELSDDLEDILTVKEIKVLSAGQEDKAIKVTSVADANKAKGLVTATIAKDDLPKYAGKEISLEIKARIKEDVKGEELAKYVTADNTAGSIPNKATLTVGDKPSQKKETEEVPVTPPGDTPNVSKKINETLDSAVVLPEADYTYNIKSTLPKDISTYKKFNIVDEVDERLTVKGTPVIKGEAAKFFKVTVTGQTVTAEITDFEAAKAYAGKEVELIITAQVKKDATVKEGENGIPNQAKVQYRNKSRQEGEPDEETPPTPPVTVTPPTDPTVDKKINGDKDHLDVPVQTDYTYNIKASLPTTITSYKKFVITDTLDKDLMVKGTPTITGDAAKFFDVKVDGQTVTATMKDFAKAGDFAGQQVELVIPAQIREGVTRVKIPNTTKVVYNNSTVDGEPDKETPPTPPVTVTPPTDPTVDKKINEKLDHLDVPVQTDYTYNIKASLPTTITSYKKFVITDTLDNDLMVKGTPTITGDAAKFFDVKVDGQTVTATMKDFANAGELAGQQVELVIPAQIREGVTRVKIPNTTKVVYNNSTVDGEPDKETPPTPPVTVTPPTDPTVDKKINGDKDHLDVPVQTDYTYNIKASLPTTITSYKKFVITDTLDKDLMVKGTPSITGDAAKFFDVKVDGQTVTATMKDFANAGDFAGQQVELVIPAQIREGVTRVKIPNTTKVVYNNSTVDGEPDKETPPTPPATVTPPTDPTVDKKINEKLDHLDVPVQTDYTYNIKASLPTTITSYKKFVITDTLDNDLMVKGTPTITGDAAKFFDVKVDGQTVTATMKDFANAGEFAGQQVELVIPAQIREGVTRVKIPNTTKVVYNNSTVDGEPDKETPPTPPVTVTPPTDPTVDKKINRTLEHLDIERNKSYMYNIYAEIPGDIENYTEYVVTDDVDPALGINGDVAVHVDGYTTDAFKVTVEGNKVTATVVDFAKLAGYKQVQIYIPAYIKEDADLTTYVDTKVPNTASLEFTNASGIKKRKETKPVTVTPPTPPTPPTPEPPKPGEPVKTVSNVEGAEQALLLKLAQATDAFRFDVKSVVPIDNSIDNRTILTSLTLMDTLDDNLKVSRVGVKVTDTPSITTPATDFNFIDEDVEVAKQELEEARQKLEALQKDTSAESQEKVAAAEAKVTELQQQLSEAQAVLDQLKVTGTTEAGDNSATPIQTQEKVVAEFEAQLEAATLALETVKAEIANAKNAEELKVDISNQQAVVDKAQEKLSEAEAKQKLVNEKVALLSQVTKQGELTAEAIEKLGGTIKVEGQNVTVDFSDEATMEALKGRTVTMIIYTEIKDVKALKNVHFSEGIDNTATVQFNHDPSVDLTKKTNKVTVVPPSPNPPKPPVPINPPTPNNPPSGNTPPPGETPPPGNTPPGNTPPTPPANHKPNLPATGDSTTYLAVVLGVMSLGLGTWVMRKKRD